MCGIAGVVRPGAPATAGDVVAVRRMLDAQAHRGPDGSDLHEAGSALLGHRRLAIIDLSEAGRQPMPNEDGTVLATYNGEIYNFPELRAELRARGHRFRSGSDGEVLVHGYETWDVRGLLSRLRGMFAFALYDAPRGRLVLARDRLGIKPLYYSEAGPRGVLAFASEVKALAASGLVPGDRDADALAGFLALGSVPAPHTWLRAVRCLPPGHYLVADRGGVRLHRYWDLPVADEDPAVPPVLGELRERLADTVRRHLVSDVPLGVFLSGGVDSTGLVALATRAGGTPLRTLTVAFPEREWSEGERARRVADAYGTEHAEVVVTAADFERGLPGFFAAMDQPTNDGLNTYLVARAARAAGLTVVLSGAGGDEVFRGYRHYRWLADRRGLLPWVLRCPDPVRRLAVGGAATMGRARGREQWMRLGYLGRRPSGAALYLALRGFFAPGQVGRLLGLSSAETASRLAATFETVRPPRGAAETSAASFGYLEARRYLHDQLLRDTDVFGMAHSLEIRVPYLDHTIVELLARVPEPLKLAPGLNKPLLAEAVGDALVLELARRPKMGFSLPLGAWMRQHAELLGGLAADADGVEPGEARRLWQAFRRGRLHWSRAWALVVLGVAGRPRAAAREAA